MMLVDLLNSYPRGRTPVDEIVLHESVTSTREATLGVLRRRGLGVHYVVDRDGSVTQHVPHDRACAHAEGFGKPSLHNERSIAIEVVNRYYGAAAQPGEDVIDAVWAHRGRYIVPTVQQLEAVWLLVVRVCGELGIPLAFPGVQRLALVGPRRFVWGRLRQHEVPGVMAHARWAHADGLYVEHYCLLRSLGHWPPEATALTRDAASRGVRQTPIPVPT